MLDRRSLLKVTATLGAGLALPAVAAPARSIPSPVWIRNATILTMDPRLGDFEQADVAISHGKIVAVGRGLTPISGSREIDANGMILIPGIVDAHWHLWNSALRNSAPTAQGETFFKSQLAASSGFTPDSDAQGVTLGLRDAANAGITTVNNWSHNLRTPAFADAELRVMKASGLRGRLWYGYPQDLPADAPMDFADVKRLQGLLAGSHRIDLGIAIRGPERTGPAVWKPEFAFAKAQGLPVSTHISVTRQAQAKGAIQQMATLGLLTPMLQLVHATHAEFQDIAAIAKGGASVCITPLSEMRVGFGLAPVVALHEAGVSLCLGTDTLVLAGNANPFMVMQTALNLATAMSENEMALTAADVLRWATQGGADSMGLGSMIGSITPGKSADLTLIDGRQWGHVSLDNAAATVVQSATPADVQCVMVDGRWVKEGGRHVSI